MSQSSAAAGEPGGLTQAERSALSDSRMFEAAINLINEVGARKMTLKQIGEHAGYSRGLASYRFGSKDGLLSELFRRFDRRWQEHIGERLADARGIEAIRAGIVAQRDFFDIEPRQLSAMYRIWYESLGEQSEIRTSLAKHHEIYREDVRRWVNQGVEDGEISPTIDAEQFAVRYCSFMFGTVYQWLVDPDALDLEALFEDYQLHVETILRSGV